jgi:Phosphopantetheine attachment site
MSAHEVRSELSVKAVEVWLVDELAGRLELRTSEIDVDRYFDEFDLDPSEAPIPARKLKSWLGFELDMTVLWRHPTIASLAQHIVDEIAERAMPDPIHTDRARPA